MAFRRSNSGIVSRRKVGTVIAGIILFGESMALLRLASVALIVCGLIGLKMSH